ncbi:MAG: putative permease [Herbinix sp.]|nr:putative permease [Herbinix sp.]
MDLNKSNMKKILGIITFTILLYVGLQHLNVVIDFLGAVFALVFPFLLGGAIAFILNVPMRGLEHNLYKLQTSKKPTSKKRISNKQTISKTKRPISLLITLLIVIGIILFVLVLVIPEIGRTIKLIGNQFPDFYRRMVRKSTIIMAEYPDIADYISKYNFDWEQIFNGIYEFLRNSGGNMLYNTFSMASTIIGGLFDFFLGFIFAVYILLQKEKLGQQSRKLIYAYLPENAADRMVSVCSLASKTFARFLSGQCLEAVILGSIFFVVMSIFRFPYTLMISVLIGFTALIPVFGSFIGCFVGAFLILIVDPWMALWFILLFIILQLIEGNFIYPHVVGGSIGLPSMWVLVAVTIGGSTMGVAGMLIFIPMSSVLYTLLREAMNRRLKIRQIPQDKYNS